MELQSSVLTNRKKCKIVTARLINFWPVTRRQTLMATGRLGRREKKKTKFKILKKNTQRAHHA